MHLHRELVLVPNVSRSQSFLKLLPHGHFSQTPGHQESTFPSVFQAKALAVI